LAKNDVHVVNRSNCSCGQIEDMKHIYICKFYEKEEKDIPYEKIYEDDVKKNEKIE